MFDKNNLVSIPLVFEEKIFTNIFKDKNKKTLKETLDSDRYKSLKDDAIKNYSAYLDEPIGEFLYNLKQSNDNFYKKFLNEYGDLEYSTFLIEDKNFHKLKGVYFYFINDEIKYIGRCKDSMKQRVNSGYGKISPKNCFKDGQSTNCKVNNLVTIYKKDDVKLKILVLKDNDEIENLEIEMIEQFRPKWNHK